VSEYPDIMLYLHALTPRVVDQTLQRIVVRGPALLRSTEPPLTDAFGKRVVGLRRIGKRIVFELEGNLFLVLHLMIAGRLQWREPSAKLNRKSGQASFEFANGHLHLTEASSHKRTSLFVVIGEPGLADHDPGGLEVLESSLDQFAEALARENHTIKRSLTDPTLFSGIGNAYSDEILHRAKLSPFKQSGGLGDEEVQRLYEATREVLVEWRNLLIDQFEDDFPKKVTAFRPEMAVHGKYGEPCPVCGSSVQRIVYAKNETNYCPTCQTEGRLLADRSLSRLLKSDWPKTLEELEERRR